jgi:hypothetical protein
LFLAAEKGRVALSLILTLPRLLIFEERVRHDFLPVFFGFQLPYVQGLNARILLLVVENDVIRQVPPYFHSVSHRLVAIRWVVGHLSAK